MAVLKAILTLQLNLFQLVLIQGIPLQNKSHKFLKKQNFHHFPVILGFSKKSCEYSFHKFPVVICRSLHNTFGLVQYLDLARP